MQVRHIIIRDTPVWISVSEVAIVANDQDLEGFRFPQQKYVCYYKLSEPGFFIIGVSFRDERNRTVLFDSVDEAFAYAEEALEGIIQ